MKCTNCGKNEANYHYTSNINGNVTERHLCSECAGKLGHEYDLFEDMDNMFENMLSGFFGRRSMLSPWGGFSRMMTPTLLMPRVEIVLKNEQQNAAETAADPEMQKAREINMLKSQMKEAAEQEDFEKAAEIRDQIKKLETEAGGPKAE